MAYLPQSRKRQDAGWRAYQQRLRRHRRRGQPRSRRRRPVLALLVLVMLAAGGWLYVAGTVDSHPYAEAPRQPAATPWAAADPQGGWERFERSELGALIGGHHMAAVDSETFQVHHDRQRLTVETTIDRGLQQHLVSRLDRRHARLIAIVAMDPDNGRILAMAGYDRRDPHRNPVLAGGHPAASIFKIVTAAAALQEAGLEPGTVLTFNGRKHTLYKSQLKETAGRWTRRISLKDSFAQSVNPVFGKLGMLRLGKEVLSAYAASFGFNRRIPFELPLPASRLSIDDEPYNWAEVASGFNRQTTISPVHGALIAAAVLNDGKMVAPALVERVVDEAGRERYRRRTDVVEQAVTPSTTAGLREMMEATVKSGTARRPFRRTRRDKVLSQLTLGGKTGSINDPTDTGRYDWFVGYAAAEDGAPRLAVCALVVHEEFIGTRAAEYARMAFRYHFGRRLAPQAPLTAERGESAGGRAR